jgi:hypothetical protein
VVDLHSISYLSSTHQVCFDHLFARWWI